VCRRLADLGGHLIDADRIAREVVAPGSQGLKKVSEHFGASVLLENGTLDRASLRRRILASDRDKKALEAIVHPEILSLMENRMAAAIRMGHGMVVVEVPLLFELDMASHFDRVVLVKARRDVKIARLETRDRVSRADARRLLGLQMPDDEKEKLSDFVIENNGSMENLIKKVDRLHEMIYSGIDNRR
jgi:dephospho-CoA kinase